MADAGAGDRDAAADAAANAGAALLSGERVETYYGENQDLQQLTALIAPLENEPPLLNILEQVPVAAEYVAPPPQAEQLVPELGPEDLLPCLRQGVWDRALDVLDGMVRNGGAVARAIEVEGINPLDITRAHPELVVLLRGQAYWDLKGREGDARADAYFHEHIELLYPDGESTGSPFVDKLLASLRLTGGDETIEHKKTYRCVMDYLKIYFLQFRHEVEEGSIRVGLFGERTGRIVRCLACHKEFEGYTPAKLRYHLMRDATGKQAKCQASTLYIREEIQAAEEAAAEIQAAEEAAALHPAPAEEPDDDGASAAGPGSTPPPDAAPTTTSTPPPDHINAVDAPAAAEDDHSTEVAPADDE